jgi:hypothetical protein
MVGTGVAIGAPTMGKARFSDTAFSPLLHRSAGILWFFGSACGLLGELVLILVHVG